MEGKNLVFRKDALDRLSTPEQLTDYLRVTRQRAWVLLAAIAVLMAGLIVWLFAGKLDVTVEGKAFVRDGRAEVVISDNLVYEIQVGQKIQTPDNKEFTITEMYYDNFGRAVGVGETSAPDSVFDVRIVVDRKSPIDLLFGER